MHARTSGLADYMAADETDALRLGRQIVKNLGHRKLGPAPGPVEEPCTTRRNWPGSSPRT